MRPPLALADAQLQLLFDPGQLKRAEAYLAAGKVVARFISSGGEVLAFWEKNSDAIQIGLAEEQGQLSLFCTCGQLRRNRSCDHVVALALAWVRAPETFESEEGEAEPDEAYSSDFAQSAPASSNADALSRAVLAWNVADPDPAGALQLQLPDLRDEYRLLLENLNLTDLRDLAKRRGVTAPANKRETLLAALAEVLGRPEAVRAAWEALSPPARLVFKVLPFVASASGGVQLNQLQAALHAFAGKPPLPLEAALQELAQAGLVFTTRFQNLAFVPALLAALPPAPGFVLPYGEGQSKMPRQWRGEPPAGPLDFALLTTRLLIWLKGEEKRLRARAEPAPHPLLRQLPMLQNWPYLPAELDALAKDHNPGGAAYRTTFTVPPAPALLTDEARAAAVRALGAEAEQVDLALRLLAAQGLVEFRPGKPVMVAEARLTEFLRQPPTTRAVRLIRTWLLLNTWTEFDRLAARRPPILLRHGGSNNFTYAHLLESLVRMRLGLVLQLRNAPAGQWSDVSVLAVRARGLNTLGGVWPNAPYAWYPDWNRRVPNLTQANDWNAIYGPYVEAVLTGPLAWLGLVELGYQHNQLAAFRPTELGAFLFGQVERFTPPPAPAAGPRLAFTPEGGLAVRAEAADAPLLALVSLLGDVRGSARGELVYAVTVEGASRAFAAGWEAEQILAALQQAAEEAVPGALAQRLRLWYRHFGEVHVYTHVALLELADDYALGELLAGTALAQYVLYRFGPRLVALRPEGVEAMRAELVKKGYTPRVEAPPGGEAPEAGRDHA